MDGNIEALGPESSRERQPGFSRQTNIENAFTGITIKMAMLGHVRTKVRRTAIERHLPDQPAFDQRVEAVIHRGHRNFRHIMFGPDKDLLGCRVVALVQQHLIHLLALRGKTKPAVRQPRIEALIELFIWGHSHGNEILSCGRAAVNIWNNSKCNQLVTAGAGSVLTFFANTREVRNPKVEIRNPAKRDEARTQRKACLTMYNHRGRQMRGSLLQRRRSSGES